MKYPTTLKLFFSKTSEKVGFLGKNTSQSETPALCDAVDILDRNPRF